jgi:hypothetical protein
MSSHERWQFGGLQLFNSWVDTVSTWSPLAIRDIVFSVLCGINRAQPEVVRV